MTDETKKDIHLLLGHCFALLAVYNEGVSNHEIVTEIGKSVLELKKKYE